VPTPLAAWSNAWIFGRTLAGTVGSNLAGGLRCLSVVSVVCRQVQVSGSD